MRVASLIAFALALGCTAEPPPPHEPLGTEEEAAFLRGAAFMRAHAPEEPLRRGEQMLVYCEIASVLPDSHARDVVERQLREDLAYLADAHPDPTALPGFNQVVHYCAEAHTDEAPPRGDWSALFVRARRRGLEGGLVIPAFQALWPHFTDAERDELRRIGRKWLSDEAWLAERTPPAHDDVRGWYRVTHVLFAVTSNGKPPDVGILTAEERDWLQTMLAEAIARFLAEPPPAPGRDDVFAEMLLNHRVLSPDDDELFGEGLRYLRALQRGDGAFVPTTEPAGLYERRHLTMISMWALAYRIAEQADTDANLSPERQQSLLESLGYVTVVPVEAGQSDTQGVVLHDPAASHPGLNLFTSREKPVARLITMEGREVHRWASDVKGATYAWFLEHLPAHVPEYLHGWNHVELLRDGDLLVIGSHHMLARLDWDSRLRWKRDLSAHHDVAETADGTLYVLTDGLRTTELDGRSVTFQDNHVRVLSPAGDVQRTISLFDAFGGASSELLRPGLRTIQAGQERRLAHFRRAARSGGPQERLLLRLFVEALRGDLARGSGAKNVLLHGHEEDVFHANSIEVLERDEPGLWRAGDLLVSVLKLDRVVVIDHESGRVVWDWGHGVVDELHDASPQPDGTIVLFDNGKRRLHSRILKVDPRSGEIVRQYVAEPPHTFFTASRGGVQELPNGNFLIAETNKGHAFEVTPEGEKVWDFYSEILDPGAAHAQRGAIYRMTRIEPEALAQLRR